LSFGFTIKEIEELFRKYNQKENGKMDFIEFVEMILPNNYNLVNIKKRYQVNNGLEVREILADNY